MSVRILEGDCLQVMPTLDVDSIDAVICDPPYGLKFMGREWDHGVPGVPFWVEALRVAKPGAYLLAFGGTRTHHRLTCAIEDAGWGIRDCLMWLYGSGFPKSHDISKAIDKAAGAERFSCLDCRDTGEGLSCPSCHGQTVTTKRPKFAKGRGHGRDKDGLPVYLGVNSEHDGTVDLKQTVPATDAARQWEGWGTALKPAWEPIIMARKPFMGTVAANVQQHGTGALNIDGCRIGTVPAFTDRPGQRSSGGIMNGVTGTRVTSGGEGRWPANLLVDEEVGRSFPESRFFYTAKASKKDRGEGNHHPTVKPLDLMQWLCRLVTPKAGLILDPFCGSGTTGRAAVAVGFRFIGIEKEPEYAAIARARIVEFAPLFGDVA